jgi:stage II sporulation protein GA (sporulation sigma-E factor processing peptidase)
LLIGIDEKEIFVEALLDTGNQLTDPVTQKPVIILGTKVLKGYVPEKVLKAVGSNEDNRITSLGEGLEAEWVRRLRLINFNSVGKKQGLMLGLRVDYIEVRTEKKKIRSEDIVIGLIDGVLNKSGKYQALLPPLLFEEYFNKEDLYAAAGENIGIKL